MKSFALLWVAHASAYPFVVSEIANARPHVSRASGETNCGPIPCGTFNAAEQYVDVSKATGHQFVAPTAADERGPCPGLK